ncbi:carboxypeptidase-like regulatory domain-containing protein [Fulvivirga sp. M361]|uniref:carboxypeptidase-like regulatory domain-containing protein n=1 Tax=Fulvivirga sp. M361 TaxID=2594266 RepID=UPI00162A625D|nr:carboxypeptidase-like regulatory domain-containing protein [Fulvivirga sp. M361]
MKKTCVFFVVLLILSSSISLHSKSVNVCGKITHASTEEGIPGANVVIKGTSYGTITDKDGNYSLEVEFGQTLVISFVGYRTEEVLVKACRIDVSLREDVISLEK